MPVEIYDKGEIYIEKDGNLVFEHTKIILKSTEDEYFYATTSQRLFRDPKIDIDTLKRVKIPVDEIWPVFDPKFTRAPDPLPRNAFVKRPRLLDYGRQTTTADLGQMLLDEAEVCEILRKCPHPNLARYLGCIVRDNKITGLCFAKYSMTLDERLKDETPFDKNNCFQRIEKGVNHMHKLGLVHNDLNPSNIMMDLENPVIIDFDSCKREGEKLGLKGGTLDWAIDGAKIARRENDIYSISKIRDFLMKTES